MREENNDNYDIQEIKKRLKGKKKEQNQRISKVKDAHYALKHLERVIESAQEKDLRTTFQALGEEVGESMVESELQLASLERKL